VIEHEFEVEEDESGNLQKLKLLYQDGKLTEKQMQELVQRHLK
jgi:DNA polymerase III delta subunit